MRRMMKIILFAIFLLVSLLTMGTQGRPIYPSKGSAEAPLAQAAQSRSFDWHQVTLDWKTVGTIIGFLGLVILGGMCLCCTAYFQALKEYLSNTFQQLIYGVVQDDIEALLQQQLPKRAHRYLELDDEDDEPRGKDHHHVEHEMGHHQRDHRQKQHVAERYNIVRNGRKDPRQMKKQQKPSIKKIIKKPIQKLNVKKFVPKAPKIVQKLKAPKFIKKMRR